MVLLGKWCWRMLVDRGGLWYRVLVACYGERNGRLEVRARSVYTWWREVAKIRDKGGGGGGEWFDKCIGRKVGNWEEGWVGRMEGMHCSGIVCSGRGRMSC